MHQEPLVIDEKFKERAKLFQVGDTVRVQFRVLEGKTDRTQAFEGVVIAFKSSASTRTFTLRKVVAGIGVERIFPLYSPNIVELKVLKRGKVRRAKLYYLRDKIGKAAKIKVDFSRPL